MHPHITVITLGMDHLERALTFSRDSLGLPTDGTAGTEFEHGAVASLRLDGRITLALWQRTSLATQAHVAHPRPAPAT